MFYSKSTGGFYITEVHGDAIPADAVEITEVEHKALLDGQAAGRLISSDSTGTPVLADHPSPTLDQLISMYTNSVQSHLDSFANTWRYESILSAATYASSTIPQFQKEALALIEWRDVTWSECYSALDKIQSGAIPMPPSIESFISGLPAGPVLP